MNPRSPLRATMVFVVILAGYALHAETPAQAAYKAGKARISAERKTDYAACAVRTGNVKDVCLANTNAKQKIARAELEFGDSDRPADVNRVQQARAEAAYSVARAVCNAHTGNARTVCVKEAKAIETAAQVDARSNQKVAEIQRDAAQEKRDADYAVAAEKCAALTGDAKSNCIAAAKARFGKT